MASGIYLWTVNRPGKTPLVYVGQARDLERRRKEYIVDWQRPNPRENERLFNAIRKYGPDRASYRVLELANDQSLLTERERHWYWHYKAQEELGLCLVANFYEPSAPPMSNPEMRAKASDGAHRRYGLERVDNWTVVLPEPRRKRDVRAQEHRFVSPTGEIITVDTLHAFCKANGLSHSKMHEVSTGKRQSYKGWTRYQEEEIYQ